MKKLKKIFCLVFAVFALALPLLFTGCDQKSDNKKSLNFWSQSAYYVHDSTLRKHLVIDFSIKSYDEEDGLITFNMHKFSVKSASAIYYVEYITYTKPEEGFYIDHDKAYITVNEDVVRIYSRYYFVLYPEDENDEPLKFNSLAELYYDGIKIGTFNYVF